MLDVELKRGIMKLTVRLALVILCSGCVFATDGPSRRIGTEVFESLSLPSLAFQARNTWPPHSAKDLVPFLVERETLDPGVVKEWQGQEDWLLAIRRLTFQFHEDDDLKKCWLQNWRAADEPKQEEQKRVRLPNLRAEDEEDGRTVYVKWEHDGLSFFGRRDFRNGECLFLVLPGEADGFDFTGSVESAQNLINSLVGKRAELSLAPLKEPRTINVAEEGGRTVRKEFKTSIIVREKHGNMLVLSYRPDTKDAPGLAPCVWLSRKALLVKIQDPWLPPWSGDGLVPLYPPPDSVTNPTDTD